MHLHWSWRLGPHLARDTRLAITACGQRNVPAGKFTGHVDDATCPACLAVARRAAVVLPSDKPRDVNFRLIKPSPPAAAKSASADGVIRISVERCPYKMGTILEGRWRVIVEHAGKTVGAFCTAHKEMRVTLLHCVKIGAVVIEEKS